VATFIINLTQHALHGELCWHSLLTASQLIVLCKPDRGMQLITMGEALYHVISCLVLKANKVMASSSAADYVSWHQYSVAFPSGVEAPVHTI
jgi:hypothetical protein